MRLPKVIKHHFSDGLYAKESFFPAGSQIAKHKHDYSHLSILALGKVCVDVDGEQFIYTAPACIEIIGGKLHCVTAITDAAWYCIHATDEKDESKIDEILIQRTSAVGG